jgi:hypothetical protein
MNFIGSIDPVYFANGLEGRDEKKGRVTNDSIAMNKKANDSG